MARGDYVQTWFDTGAMGCTILYGVVIAAGSKSYTVRWESGIRNRIKQGDKRVLPAGDKDTAARALDVRAWRERFSA